MSYDPPDAVRAFAESHHINYPLLSDRGSRVIRELGILDEDLEAHHAVFGVPTRPEQLGVAFPMTVTFQACSATECLPPNAVALVLAVPEAPAP